MKKKTKKVEPIEPTEPTEPTEPIDEKGRFKIYINERAIIVKKAKKLISEKKWKNCLSLLTEPDYKDDTVQNMIDYCNHKLEI